MSIANNLFQDLTIDRQMLKRVQHDEMIEEEGKNPCHPRVPRRP